LSFGDYIFGSKREDGVTLEPQGYYFHVGPALKTSYVVTEDLWVDGFFHYDIGFKAGKGSGQHIDGYKKPHFMTIGANVNHAHTRLFAGFRINHLIDRGANKDSATRLDISAGYMF
jgi:hypothetical protein